MAMTEMTRSSFSAAALLAKWQMFGFALVALGRAIVRGERMRVRGAWEAAHHLEVVAHVAAHELSADLDAALAEGVPADEGAIAALEHLAFVRTLLLVLALFAQHMRLQLAGRGAACAPDTEFSWTRAFRAGDQALTLPFSLDSS